MKTKEIFAAKNKKYNSLLKLNEIKENLYDFLIMCEVSEKKAANISFEFDVDTLLKSKEFSEDEKEFILVLKKQYLIYELDSF